MVQPIGLGGLSVGMSPTSDAISDEESIRRGIVFVGARRETLTNGSQIHFHILTGSAPVVMRFTFTSEGNSRISFREDSTFTSDGTVLSVFNRNRNSSRIAQTQIWYNPTLNSGGTILGLWHNPSSIAQIKSFILKPNTRYYVQSVNSSGVTTDSSIVVDWYERDLDLIV